LWIDHIVPRKHGGDNAPGNLAMACARCNRHRGPNLTGIDPETREIVPLFHPRRQSWHEHFAFHSALIVGTTPTGRATVRVLCMNTDQRLRLRAALLVSGELD
jgi:5-methylcytosine-specific restriction endonuclease McrA